VSQCQILSKVLIIAFSTASVRIVRRPDYGASATYCARILPDCFRSNPRIRAVRLYRYIADLLTLVHSTTLCIGIPKSIGVIVA